MKLNFRSMLMSSLMVIGVGVVLVIVLMILGLLPLALDPDYAKIVRMIGSGYAFLMIPVFFALFFICGMRAVRKFKLDSVEAGAASAFSYIVIGAVHLVLGTILNIVVLSQVIEGTGFGSAETQLASAIFGELSGAAGIGISALCGLGIILIGAMINFVIGGFGGLYAQRK